MDLNVIQEIILGVDSFIITHPRTDNFKSLDQDIFYNYEINHDWGDKNPGYFMSALGQTEEDNGEVVPADEAAESSTSTEEMSSSVETSTEITAETGHEPGRRPEDFTLECTDGSTFSLSAQRGKVVVINLWATWCGPCVKELPYFEELYTSQGDQVAVLAIHSDLITDDVDEWLSKHDYTMPFAIDYGGEVIASLGGSTMLPQTIILDRNGIAVYNAVGSMTEEKLMSLVEPLF